MPDDRAARDRDWIAELQAGKPDALVGLYETHASTILALALRVLGSRADAEDLVHDVFVEAWQGADSYDATRGSVRTWLLMRTRSRAIDRLRSLARAREKGVLLFPVTERVRSVESPDRRRARDAVGDLSDVQRVVVELSYFEGLTCREIGERCGIPLGTVKSRLAAAMRSLRNAFGVISAPNSEVKG